MVIFYKKWKKYNEFQLTKNKMDLNIRKMTNHPPSPVNVYIHLHQRKKRGSTIQYGYWKWGTRASVFSQTLAHGNSKNEIRQTNNNN